MGRNKEVRQCAEEICERSRRGAEKKQHFPNPIPPPSNQSVSKEQHFMSVDHIVE